MCSSGWMLVNSFWGDRPGSSTASKSTGDRAIQSAASQQHDKSTYCSASIRCSSARRNCSDVAGIYLFCVASGCRLNYFSARQICSEALCCSQPTDRSFRDFLSPNSSTLNNVVKYSYFRTPASSKKSGLFVFSQMLYPYILKKQNKQRPDFFKKSGF